MQINTINPMSKTDIFLQPHFGPTLFIWSCTKNKVRRPIILPEGVIGSIVRDTREFLDTADWHTKFHIVEDIFFMGLLELAKVCFFFLFCLCFLTENEFA